MDSSANVMDVLEQANLTVADLVASYSQNYPDYLNLKPGSLKAPKRALRLLANLFGGMNVKKFDSVAMNAIKEFLRVDGATRRSMLEKGRFPFYVPFGKEKNVTTFDDQYSLSAINQPLIYIRRIFRYGMISKFVSNGQYAEIQAIRNFSKDDRSVKTSEVVPA